jgi:hypothetical protein
MIGFFGQWPGDLYFGVGRVMVSCRVSRPVAVSFDIRRYCKP